MLVTTWVGMYLASSKHLPWQTFIYGTLGIALAAGSAAVVNHLLDRHIDIKMSRTSVRPIASGRISLKNAIIFASVLSICAFAILSSLVNVLTTILTFVTLLGYAFFYTLYLKRATPQNIVIGGLSGAMPPLLGWSAVTGSVSPWGLLLVLIIFTWTPPHFWALAIYRVEDYTKAEIPMLPVTHGIPFTKLCIILYTFLLIAATSLLFAVGMSGKIYIAVSSILNIIFLYLTIKLYFANGQQEKKLAIDTFKYSIYYLSILFVALIVDHKFMIL